MTRPRRSSAVAAAAAFASLSLVASSQAATLPSVVFDLRVHDTGGKTATVSSVGDSVLLDLYVTPIGLDANPANDILQIASGLFRSSTGGLRGDLLGLRPPSPFDGGSSSIGAQNDIDSDGDLDVGTLGTAPAGKYAARTDARFPQPAGGYFIGQARFTAMSITNDSTSLNFELRPGTSAGTVLAWFDGSTMATPNNPSQLSILYGAPVVVQGNAGTGGEIEFISGMISDHRTISTNTTVPQGHSLHFNTGFDVTSTGSLSATGGTAHINDTTSGNAGGTLVIDDVAVAPVASGKFTQAGGFSSMGDLTVGGAGYSAEFVTTGGTLQTGAVSVGPGSGSLLRASGGTSTFGATKVYGGSRVEFDGATVAVNGQMDVGINGEATLAVTDGDVAISGILSLGGLAGQGAGSGGKGHLRIEGGMLRSYVVHAGVADSPGHIVQTGGTVLSNAYFTVGSDLQTGYSTYTLSAGTLRGAGIYVGERPDTGVDWRYSGAFTQTGGEVDMSLTIHVYSEPDRSAVYTLAAGTLNAAQLRVGNQIGLPDGLLPGRFNQLGGTAEFDILKVGRNASVSLAGGTLRVDSELDLRGTLNLNNAPLVLTFNGLADFSDGIIQNGSNARLVGGPKSVMTFKDAAQLGSVSVETLGIIHVLGQTLSVAPSKTLGGTGVIQGDVVNNGTVSPGNSPGVISITGNYTQSATASLLMELAGTSLDPENPGFDILSVSGLASLDGLLSVALLDGFVPLPSDQFKIVSASSLAGTFDNTVSGITLPQGHFDVLYSPTGVTLTNFQAIPEPTGAALLMVAAGLLARRRRV